MIQVKRLGEVGIVVSDLARSLAWYREKLGFVELFDVKNGVVIGNEQAHLWLAETGDPDAARPVDTAKDICQRLFSFEVSAEELQRVPAEFREDRDIVHIEHPRYESYIVEDPDGHAIEFYMMRPEPVEMRNNEQIVALVDVESFAKAVRLRTDGEVFQMLDLLYHRVEEEARKAGGGAWKYLGDGVLVAFPIDRATDAARCVEALPEAVLPVWETFGIPCKVRVKADVLSLAWGRIGRLGAMDAIGQGLNELFMHMGEGGSVSSALRELAQKQSAGE